MTLLNKNRLCLVEAAGFRLKSILRMLTRSTHGGGSFGMLSELTFGRSVFINYMAGGHTLPARHDTFFVKTATFERFIIHQV